MVVNKFEENGIFSFESLIQKRTGRWLNNFFQLKDYHDKNKNFTFPVGDRKLINLGKWLTQQRVLMRNNMLFKEQIDLLQKLGVKETCAARAKNFNEEKWNGRFLQLKTFYESTVRVIVMLNEKRIQSLQHGFTNKERYIGKIH